MNEKQRSYIAVVSYEHFFLQGADVCVQEMEPLLLVADLLHVDVPSGHILVAAFYAGVLKWQRSNI